MYPPRETPRDMGLACKKRQHPDGLQLSSSLPKRLLSSLEGEISSSIDNTSISPGTAINTPHGSLCNSASSALINSDCSTSIRPTHSRISLDAACSKLEGPGFGHSLIPSSDVASCKLEGPSFVLSRIPSDAASSKLEGAGSLHSLRPCTMASYNLGALNSTKESLGQGKGKAIWSYRSVSAKLEGLDCEGELSGITSEKHARAFSSGHEPDGVSGSEKATHVISRRDVSSLNSKDELWHKAAYGHGEYVSRGKQWESSSTLYGARQRRDNANSSMACESASSSCATADSPMEEIRPKQAFPHVYRSVRKESSSTPSHTHEVLVGPRSQERIGCMDENIIQRRPSSGVVLHPSTHKVATEECSPSYVLSSGRMSLEEEARLGRRARTIDHDFEEYFSSLML